MRSGLTFYPRRSGAGCRRFVPRFLRGALRLSAAKPAAGVLPPVGEHLFYRVRVNDMGKQRYILAVGKRGLALMQKEPLVVVAELGPHSRLVGVHIFGLKTDNLRPQVPEELGLIREAYIRYDE